MFYGICFNYAQAAYDDISQYQSHYESLGMKKSGWYIAGVLDNPRQITLYDPVSRGQATMILNGVYVKEASRQNARAHGSATYHAWLWVYGNDGEIYWIDPTWTDNNGYVVWGVVRDGEEVQLNPLEALNAVKVDPASRGFAEFNRGNANKNNEDYGKAIEDYTEALRLNPNAAPVYHNRGNAYTENGDYDKAATDYERAAKLDPQYAAARRDNGNVAGGYKPITISSEDFQNMHSNSGNIISNSNLMEQMLVLDQLSKGGDTYFLACSIDYNDKKQFITKQSPYGIYYKKTGKVEYDIIIDMAKFREMLTN
jgi:tetratricopeptide (TPR) repeat protein